MNFNQRICKAPTCFHAYAEPHPPHKADICRLLTLQNTLPIHGHYTTACLFISSHLDCLAALKWWKTKPSAFGSRNLCLLENHSIALHVTHSGTDAASNQQHTGSHHIQYMHRSSDTMNVSLDICLVRHLASRLTSHDQWKDRGQRVLIIQQQWGSVYRGPCGTERTSWATQLRSDL